MSNALTFAATAIFSTVPQAAPFSAGAKRSFNLTKRKTLLGADFKFPMLEGGEPLGPLRAHPLLFWLESSTTLPWCLSLENPPTTLPD